MEQFEVAESGVSLRRCLVGAPESMPRCPVCLCFTRRADALFSLFDVITSSSCNFGHSVFFALTFFNKGAVELAVSVLAVDADADVADALSGRHVSALKLEDWGDKCQEMGNGDAISTPFRPSPAVHLGYTWIDINSSLPRKTSIRGRTAACPT